MGVYTDWECGACMYGDCVLRVCAFGLILKQGIDIHVQCNVMLIYTWLFES